MPFILVVLFSIALLVTCTGLFLSPRSQTRTSRERYLPATRGQRIIEADPMPVQTRERRSVHAATLTSVHQITEIAPVRVRERQRVPETSTSSIPQRASREREARSSAHSVAIQRMVVKQSTTAIPRFAPRHRLFPGYHGRLRDGLDNWKVIIPGLCTLFLLAFYLFNLLLAQPLKWTAVWFGSTQAAVTPTAQPAQPTSYQASKDLVRLSQLDSAQYASTQEYNTWAYSACSAASMTEVINAYGHKYRITTILEKEAGIHEITPDEGLLEESGIAATGKLFGFNTSWGHNLSLDQVIAAANSGTPVIVSFPPGKYPGGHLLVVRGGDKNSVVLADSSIYNRTTVTRAFFLTYWAGFSAIMKPA